ncbi:MAG: transcriptional repressor [Duncaniella sp.]|nr:transcriptional repressor [Duncaniella sp.]
MMNTNEIEKLLSRKGIAPTANRISVFRELEKCSHPVSLADLETILYPMDKASIFRTLELFSGKDILHMIEDGSRSVKYELCHGSEHHSVADQHAHFYCEKCGVVECLPDIEMPKISLPEGYEMKSINFMLKGICPRCAE